jgi:hypothetical protein
MWARGKGERETRWNSQRCESNWGHEPADAKPLPGLTSPGAEIVEKQR